jgi:cytochrome c oxidase cbb3-type subunit 1
MYPYYFLRFLGGAVFFLGMFIMVWNVWKTIAGEKPVVHAVPQTAH